MVKGPAFCRASISLTSAAGFLLGLGRFAYLHSVSVAAHSLNALCPSHDLPCHVVQRQHDVTLPHFREVLRLCCDPYLPCRLRKFSPQGAPTDWTCTRSLMSRNGVIEATPIMSSTIANKSSDASRPAPTAGFGFEVPRPNLFGPDVASLVEYALVGKAAPITRAIHHSTIFYRSRCRSEPWSLRHYIWLRSRINAFR